MEQEIIREATGLGFAAIGFAAAGPSETSDIFNGWLESGRHAGMEFLKKHAARRSDLRKLEPGVRSIIVAAARYPVSNSPGSGFSFYAQGRDYHEVLGMKLGKLAEFLKKNGASVARVCVDIAPVSEREWAVRAGIGWRGKQGQIVNPENGCCLVLGEILVDLDLYPSAPLANRCGECRKCVDACPAGALCDDGLVDARKCISYLTIEHKGDFTREETELVGESLFGCDVCTAICPWNRFGNERVMPEFAGELLPSPEDCLRLTEAEFEKRFKGTAVFRTGLKRLKRNAAAAVANPDFSRAR